MTPTVKKKVAFATLGCRVNQYDTQALRESLGADFETVPFEHSADVYVINTCTVTAAADAEGRQLVRRAKAGNPAAFVVVTGCLAEDRPRETAALPGVDLVLGNREKNLLADRLLGRVSAAPPGPWGAGISRFDGHQRATVKVQDGCNFGCAFCLIPRVRGRMTSRPGDLVLAEARRLAEGGVKELVLAGIQLSSYGRDWGQKASEPRLAPLVGELLRVPGIRRVRLSSYAVADFEDALLPLWAEDAGLCPHLHLPLQSGDEGVLKAMRRPYSLEDYRRTVEKARRAAPRLGLTGDILAGFPGETDQAFRNTLDRIRELGFADFHPFPYSDRPDTPGEAMGPKVPAAVIRERMDALLALKAELNRRSAEAARDRVFPLVVERHGPRTSAGLTDEGLRVLFPLVEGGLGREVAVRVVSFQEGRAWGRVGETGCA
ncbi:MAG TPA: tRNA (N(6)-L-threonylcarbamoyladenosine(37)-C(2))-methylthiotransferase MtaB [bacterium]|nr:tRNA (N(6)-L-threonylcarbamoyladenosine(37)-C(2))-methylthiotransferase MtaB [bacterium]